MQVNLVLIDVVVRDRKERPISGLTRDDFELLVDRLPVDPSSVETFEEICSAEPGGQAQAASTAAHASPDGAAAAAPAAPGPSRHIVILLDFSHMTFAGARQSLRAARNLIGSGIGPSDRIMLLAFKRSLRLVQDFTSSASLLAARLDELITDSATLDTEVLDESQKLGNVARSPCDMAGGQCTGRRAQALALAIEEEKRARSLLSAIENLMPALAGVRGRKAFVLFSDVLRDEPGVEYLSLARSTPFAEGIDIKEDLQRVTREANAAGVSFYTVHASGLDDSVLDSYRDARAQTTMPTAGSRSVTFTTVSSDIGETYDAGRAGLDSALAMQSSLAAETGGRALQRTNDVGAIITTAQQDLACYYMLGYRHAERGDNARHSLIVHLKENGHGQERRGLTVRHRPYFIDYSPQARRDRLVQSALRIPEVYKALPITSEAFALAPDPKGRAVLIKATVPLDALSLIPAGGSWMEGRVLVKGNVTQDGQTACQFEHEIPLRLPRDAKAERFVFETGCVVKPGTYDLTLAVLDPTTQEVGARRSTLVVPEAAPSASPYVSDLYLWTHDPRALVVAAGAEAIGLKDTGPETLSRVFIPQAQRRLEKQEEAMLTFFVCPPAASAPGPESPLRIHRSLEGEGDAVVAGFRDLSITEPPDARTGCYQFNNTIPAGTLGDGIYKFTIQLLGLGTGSSISREAALAVH